jgi:hypothetical protein
MRHGSQNRASGIRYKEVHTAVVRQFPYMVHYTVDQQTKTIEIIAVLSTHRDPELWNERSK